MQISPDGAMAATVSQEKTCKVFDVVNFDMINMLKLDFVPVCCGWIFQRWDWIPEHMSIVYRIEFVKQSID